MIEHLAMEGFHLATDPATTPAQAADWLARWGAVGAVPADALELFAARWREQEATCPYCGGDPETHEAVDF